MDLRNIIPVATKFADRSVNKMSDLVNQAKSSLSNNRFMDLADQAEKASRTAFPGQGWDEGQRNAARHSIWMSLLANEMGGGAIARGAAKGIGYANEGIGLVNGNNLTISGAKDMRHDLNNNAVGLNTLADLNTQGQPTQQQIIDALLEKARQSKIVRAPSVLSPDIGVLSRGE